MGPFEGHQIGEWLGLEEVEAPEHDPGPEQLEEGQYYLWHAMDRHPDLHALVNAAQLGAVAKAIDHFHVRVLKGNRFLPEAPADTEAPAPPPPSYIEMIEADHKPFWCRGPRAIVQAVVLGMVPTVIILVGSLIIARHVGDHRQVVGPDEVFRRASLAAVEQSALENFWNPDHSSELRTHIGSVCYIDGATVVLIDGQVLEFVGMRDVRPLFERARAAGSAPRMDIDIVDGRAMISGISVGGERTVAQAELVRNARLPSSSEAPARTRRVGTDRWYVPDRLPLGDTQAMRSLVGQKLCLSGTLQEVEGSLQIRCVNGELFYVDPVRDTPAMREFLAFFLSSGSELRMDVVLTEVFRTGQQEATGVIGRADLYSASAQNYHIVASR
ncbi:hypothetical protein DRQ53_03050 [bacterium]|nr:MAG: hypothetical protein DRQ53_03050 [bacterium]